MADFWKLHSPAVERAWRAAPLGGYFTVALREPLGSPTDGPLAADAVVFVVSFRRSRDGTRYAVADEASQKLIDDWQARHKDTPADAFELPAGLLL